MRCRADSQTGLSGPPLNATVWALADDPLHLDLAASRACRPASVEYKVHPVCGFRTVRPMLAYDLHQPVEHRRPPSGARGELRRYRLTTRWETTLKSHLELPILSL